MKLLSLSSLKYLVLFCLALAPALGATQEFLPPEEAFRIEAEVLDPQCKRACQVDVTIEVEPEYYLYRERFDLQPGTGVTSAQFSGLPNGERKYDEFLEQEIEALRGTLAFRIEYDRSAKPEGAELVLVSQGCADAGLCYPPMSTPINLTESGGVGQFFKGLGLGDSSRPSSPSLFENSGGFGVEEPQRDRSVESAKLSQESISLDESGGLAQQLSDQPLYVVLPVFFGLGLLLAFTPCTLPMLPIVTSLVVGQQSQSGVERTGRFRAFGLALVYVLGMSLTYALLGVIAGLSGQSLVVALQQPIVLWTFGSLLALLGVALLLGYQIQLPAAFQAWLQERTGRLQGGQYLPVLIMGVLSALLLGPCVAPPLAGALLYIGQTGNALTGGMALFVLALGMGLPMVLIAAGAGTLLPRAGHWMKVVSGVFGFVLLAVALWIVNPVTPASVLFALWVVWLVLVAGAIRNSLDQQLISSNIARSLWTGVAVLAQALALIYLAGLLSGAPSLLKPLSALSGGSQVSVDLHKSMFDHVPSGQFEAELARTEGPVLLDFYADWCVSCKEFELLTLPDEAVQNRLADIRLIQVDVTENTVEDQALLKKYGLFGPPAILFFNSNKQELKSSRVVGFQNVEKFSQTLDQVRQGMGLLPIVD